MMKSGKIDTLLLLRLIGALIGGIGFIFLALSQPVLGTSLIGIGSLVIAGAGGK